MTTSLPNSHACSQVEAYEDMFKEITRKLYGEVSEASQPTSATHTAPGSTLPPDVERSFTNLLSDRNSTLNDFDHGGVGVENVSSLKSDNNLTAFGLALMQNGYTPNSILNSQTFQQVNKQNQTNSVLSTNLSSSSDNVNSPHGQNNVASEIIPLKGTQHANEVNVWNSKSENYQHSQKQLKNKKLETRENSIMLHSPNNLLPPNESLKSTNGLNGCTSGIAIQQTNASNGQNLQKRYNCSNCPYSTDRRDLFTRHENIHKEDKPFHCYVCLKQFNRADHVKKHFLRMHRGLNYDIGRTKRSITQQKAKKSNSSGYYNHTSNIQTGLNMPITFASLQNQQMEQQSQTAIIDQTSRHLENTFHSNGETASNNQNSTQQLSVKVEKIFEKSTKKGDKRFVCCYCSWTGSDNWGLKRHLNTHTKPFVCVLCDYKAARSERLATHVFKVHNKKVCTKCNYLAENQNEYNTHINDAHANESRSQRSNPVTNSSDLRSAANHILRNSFSTSNSFNTMQPSPTTHAFNNWRTMMGGTGISSPNTNKTNGNSNINQKKGAERLFQYFEADDSDPEDYARQLQMAAISRNTQAVAQDFHNAGGGKTMRVKYAKNSIENLHHYYRMYGQKSINEFLHSIDVNINSTEKNLKSIVPDLELIIGPNISPPANHRKMSDQLLAKPNSFDHQYDKENVYVNFQNTKFVVRNVLI